MGQMLRGFSVLSNGLLRSLLCIYARSADVYGLGKSRLEGEEGLLGTVDLADYCCGRGSSFEGFTLSEGCFRGGGVGRF